MSPKAQEQGTAVNAQELVPTHDAGRGTTQTTNTGKMKTDYREKHTDTEN